MPEHLVERINAEQAHREHRLAVAPKIPLRATVRARLRILLVVAGAAAAVALIMFASTNIFTAHQPSAGISTAAGIDRTSGAATVGGAVQTGGPVTPTLVQISVSGTRYTQFDFVAQARALLSTPFQPISGDATSSTTGLTPTSSVLMQCLQAIGAGGAQTVRADLALYDGRPAMIIVATTNGTPTAYVVARECTRTNAALIQPATPLP
jgi:hypothetical protein